MGTAIPLVTIRCRACGRAYEARRARLDTSRFGGGGAWRPHPQREGERVWVGAVQVFDAALARRQRAAGLLTGLSDMAHHETAPDGRTDYLCGRCQEKQDTPDWN